MTPLTKINGEGHVAMRYGMEEAVFLESLMFWYRTNRGNNTNYRDGRWWTYNTIKAYVTVFPWWTSKQIRRIVESCREKGALLAANYNEDKRDRTLWYTPSDDLLTLYGEEIPGNCSCPNGQTSEPDRADSCAQTGEPLPCSNHVETDMFPPVAPQGAQAESKPEKKTGKVGGKSKTVPAYRPDWFERFWALYPRRTNRVAAVRAWDKLRPDLELCKVMKVAILAQMQTPQWRDGPEHVPHPSTWLNGARWLDEVSIPAGDDPGGYVLETEVY